MKVHILVTQPVASLPNVFKLYHGLLYSRWFALSALFDILLAMLGYLCWHIIPRPPGFLSPLWHISNWGFPGQCLLVAAIFMLFLLGSPVVFLISYRFFEGSTNVHRNRSRSIEFENLRWLLGIYAVLISVVSLYDWLLKKMQPVPFALALIFLFVTIWTGCHDILPGEATEPLNKEQSRLLSARYLFCCLFRLRWLVPDNPETAIEGMNHFPANENEADN